MNFVRYVAIAALLGVSVQDVGAIQLGKKHHHKHHKKQLVNLSDEAPAAPAAGNGALTDDSEVKEWKAALAEAKDELDELQGKVIVPKTEEEEKAELEQATTSLAAKAEANKRVDDYKKAQKKVADLEAALADGSIDEAEVQDTKSTIDKMKAKMSMLEVQIEEDGNAARLEEAGDLEK